MRQSRVRLFWTVFSAASSVKWWMTIVWVNMVIAAIVWTTHAVPQLVVDIDGLVLLVGSLVILTRSIVRYQKAREQMRTSAMETFSSGSGNSSLVPSSKRVATVLSRRDGRATIGAHSDDPRGARTTARRAARARLTAR